MDPRVRIPKTVLFRELDGEAVLLSLANGTYFSLNPTGTRMWQLIHACDGDLHHVLDKLVEEFEVSEEQCRADLTALTASLCQHGLLEPLAAPSA